jgi:hypothetical protein
MAELLAVFNVYSGVTICVSVCVKPCPIDLVLIDTVAWSYMNMQLEVLMSVKIQGHAAS